MSRACANIAKLTEEGEDYAKEGGECSKDMDQVREACSNVDEVVQCAADASDEDALKNCQRETCKPTEN